MRIAGIVHDSIVDGPGLRLAIFCQGCPLGCPGCHNADTHNVVGGTELPVEDLVRLVQTEPLARGLTLSGGEPTVQAASCAALACAAKARGWDVWCWSGYGWDALCRRMEREPDLVELFDNVDVCVAGPYVQGQRTLSLSWRGSSNQVLVNVPASRRSRRLVLAAQANP